MSVRLSSSSQPQVLAQNAEFHGNFAAMNWPGHQLPIGPPVRDAMPALLPYQHCLHVCTPGCRLPCAYTHLCLVGSQLGSLSLCTPMLLATTGSHCTHKECSSAPGQLQAHKQSPAAAQLLCLHAQGLVSIDQLRFRQLTELLWHLIGYNYAFSNKI